jgi:predicted Ser/Thr protein kinase
MLPLSSPTKLGRYEIVDEIGKGAMGVVYLARDPLIGRLVALKTFRIGLSVKDAELEQFRARFIREAQSAGILSHPNIVTIHDVVERGDDGMAFIAMEYVRGTNLKVVLQASQRPTLSYVAEILGQVAAGLDYAHSCKVIHRDIKPANILITADNRAKITDFGIARLDTSNLTQEGQLLGTPNYMSPEQILGRDVDSRADIFSLGVVLYEMVTRHKPFQGDNLTMVSHRIVYDHFTPPREYVDDLPPGTEQILAKALEKDPGRRYQRAHDMAEDLRKVVGSVAARDVLNETQSLSSTAMLPRSPLPQISPVRPALVGGTGGVPAEAPGGAGVYAATTALPSAALLAAARASVAAADSPIPAAGPRPSAAASEVVGAKGGAAAPAGATIAELPTAPLPIRGADRAPAPPPPVEKTPGVPIGGSFPGAPTPPASPVPPASPASPASPPPPLAAAPASNQYVAPPPAGLAGPAAPAVQPPAAAAAPAGAAQSGAAAAASPAPAPSSSSAAPRRGLLGRPSALGLLAAVAIGGVLGLGLAGALMMWTRGQETPRSQALKQVAAETVRRQVLSLMADGRRRLEAGDADGAIAAFRAADQLAPGHRGLLKLRTAAEHQQNDQRQRLGQELQIEIKLNEGRQALADRHYDEAETAAQAVLAMSPGNTVAGEILNGVKAARTRAHDRAAALSAQAARPIAVPQPPVAPATAPHEAPAAAAPAEAKDATLDLAFFSQLPEGSLLVYINGSKMVQESFRFYDKSGLFRSHPTTGWVRRSFHLKPGSVEIRLYVTPAGSAAVVKILNGNFPAGAARRLEVRLTEAGDVSYQLN